MDLKTSYLGLELANPIVCGAAPLGTTLDSIKQLEDAGVAAVVLPSLFEEEILAAVRTQLEIESQGAGFAEASSYLPDPEGYHVGPDQYLELLREATDATSIPIIGSLNGSTPGGWTDYAAKMAEAGAAAIELNVYDLSTDPGQSGAEVEERAVEIVRAVDETVDLPIAVKLSPFYSSLPHLAKRLVEAGADGLVIFNRFYQPDIDIEELDVYPNLRLSTADELRLRLRWLAILFEQVDASLACTGGAHNAVDVIKAIMAGADVVQLVSALLIHGPDHVGRTLEAVQFWMTEHEYESVAQMRGSMSLVRSPNPTGFVRANYMKMLESWER
jgi:dihydroorotate dehydrogenase (fumarate)